MCVRTTMPLITEVTCDLHHLIIRTQLTSYRVTIDSNAIIKISPY